ncbi:uncharacterized protein EV420DRAFT_1753526 [Desarmillaria tabescens]|uniref:Uncharacterized protein n=1 Tax=Armillaria tabescens TaxID=1929756 RepID=A0AA39J8R3_ARMTA|nr:uncharacterized protein EV420DRAFT_1753526 [Desarmillaria tabescens]KAK0437291.1 hypothetical protein EV420DRAFT_1753526 [Desarmillaria tabescens]
MSAQGHKLEEVVTTVEVGDGSMFAATIFQEDLPHTMPKSLPSCPKTGYTDVEDPCPSPTLSVATARKKACLLPIRMLSFKTDFEGSDGTRSTAQYDMHLHPQLILKDIIFFPNMLEHLADVVNSKLYLSTGNTRSLSQVPDGHDLHRRRVHEVLNATSGFTIGPEADLQRDCRNLQKLSSLVASTLVADLDQWSSIFQYSEKPILVMPYALAGGYLLLNKDIIAKAGLPNDLDGGIRLVIEVWMKESWNAKGVESGVSNRSALSFYAKHERAEVQTWWKKKTRKATKKRSTSDNGPGDVEGGDTKDEEGAKDDSAHRLPCNEGGFTKALKIIQQHWFNIYVLNAGSREWHTGSKITTSLPVAADRFR